MKHYTKEELELYRNGKMSILGRITCSSHLKTCEQCSKTIKALEDDDTLIKHLRSSLQIYQDLLSEENIQTS